MIYGKHLRGGAASGAYNGGEARGKGYREGGEAAHRGGGYRGRQEQEWKAGRHDERKSSACRSGVGAAPRACVYI